MISGGGSIQDGSLRAANRLKDVSNAALEQFLTMRLVANFASRQHLNERAFKRALFCTVTWPRAEISTENVKTL